MLSLLVLLLSFHGFFCFGNVLFVSFRSSFPSVRNGCGRLDDVRYIHFLFFVANCADWKPLRGEEEWDTVVAIRIAMCVVFRCRSGMAAGVVAGAVNCLPAPVSARRLSLDSG